MSNEILKNKILERILNNKYFKYLCFTDTKLDFAEIAKFATIDDRVIMSADNKIFVLQ